MTTEIKVGATPGPWEYLAGDGVVVTQEKYGAREIAWSDADYRLVAAAPELLEACRRLLKFNEELCSDVNVSQHYPSAEFARAVIAKAKGAQ